MDFSSANVQNPWKFSSFEYHFCQSVSSFCQPLSHVKRLMQIFSQIKDDALNVTPAVSFSFMIPAIFEQGISFQVLPSYELLEAVTSLLSFIVCSKETVVSTLPWVPVRSTHLSRELHLLIQSLLHPYSGNLCVITIQTFRFSKNLLQKSTLLENPRKAF